MVVTVMTVVVDILEFTVEVMVVVVGMNWWRCEGLMLVVRVRILIAKGHGGEGWHDYK